MGIKWLALFERGERMVISKDDILRMQKRKREQEKRLKNKNRIKRRKWSRARKFEENINKQLKDSYLRSGADVTIKYSTPKKLKEEVLAKFRRRGWVIKEVGYGGVNFDNKNPTWIFLEFR